MLMLAHDDIKMVARHDLNPHVLQLCFSLTACVSVMKLKEYVNHKTLHLTNGINFAE